MKEEELKSLDESSVLKSVVFFIANFYLASVENPTEEDAEHAARLARLTLLLMAQMAERSMKQRREPVFNAMFYVKDYNGIPELNYCFETIGGQLFEELGLGAMGKELEEAIGKWCIKIWGGELHTKAAEVMQAWGGVIKDETGV